jgi:hypothetical protein
MSGTAVATAHRLLTEAVDALSAAADNGATDAELLSVLTVCEGVGRNRCGCWPATPPSSRS